MHFCSAKTSSIIIISQSSSILLNALILHVLWNSDSKLLDFIVIYVILLQTFNFFSFFPCLADFPGTIFLGVLTKDLHKVRMHKLIFYVERYKVVLPYILKRCMWKVKIFLINYLLFYILHIISYQSMDIEILQKRLSF